MTCVMVTHDQEEAMTMASRIAVMSEGRMLQVGAPGEIYETPANRFVADFIGNVNLMDGTAGRGRARPRGDRLRRLPPLRRPRHHRHRGMAVTWRCGPRRSALPRAPTASRPAAQPGARHGQRDRPTSAASPSTTWRCRAARVLKVSQSNTERHRERRSYLGRRGVGELDDLSQVVLTLMTQPVVRGACAAGAARVIGVPYLWLLVFFLLPFLIVLKISVSEMESATFKDLVPSRTA